MKLINRFLILSLMVAVSAASCKKDDIEMTVSEPLAGEWFVTADALDASGSVIAEDPYGIGHFLVVTYGTSENNGSQIFIDDAENFWSFKGKISSDLNALTFSGPSFSGDDVVNEYLEDVDPDPDVEKWEHLPPFSVRNGKILKGAATTPSGMPADSIVFEVKFSDDDTFEGYRISGYRYTGLVNDEDH